MGRRRSCGLPPRVSQLLGLLVLVHGVYSGSLSISITEQRVSLKCRQQIADSLPVQMGLVELLLHQLHMRLKSLQERVHGAGRILELTDLFVLLGHLSLGDVADEGEVVLDACEHVFGREIG